MNYYFGTTSNMEMQFLGIIHIITILITILSIFLIYKNKSTLKNIPLDKIAAIIIIINLIISTLGALLTNNFDIGIHLPLQYCYITGLLYSYMVFTKQEKIFNFLYYAIFFCTISVVIFQDTSVGYDRYDFILLLLSHHLLLISCFYTLVVSEYKVNLKGIKNFIIYSVIVYAIAFTFNLIFETNYIFSDSFPPFMYDILPFLNYANPLIWMVIFSIPMVLCAYMPIKKQLKK